MKRNSFPKRVRPIPKMGFQCQSQVQRSCFEEELFIDTYICKTQSTNLGLTFEMALITFWKRALICVYICKSPCIYIYIHGESRLPLAVWRCTYRQYCAYRQVCLGMSFIKCLQPSFLRLFDPAEA